MNETFCEKCEKLSWAEKFCPECGKPNGMDKCPACGLQMIDGERFCYNCGHRHERKV